ncbi:MAG: YgiT-type zinc finger protein [Firmicutes bacterium]|nr:YgiT-type zinc finger protein [Bacillota bacterium]
MKERLCRCGRSMVQERRTITREIDNRKITITNVPVLYCKYCQETLYNARTVKKMDELIRRFPDKTSLIYPNLLEPNSDVLSFLDKLDLHGTLIAESEEPVRLYEVISLVSFIQSKLRSA